MVLINTTVFIGLIMPSACTQTFPGIRRVKFTGRVSCYILIKYEEELQFFLYQERLLNTNTQNII